MLIYWYRLYVNDINIHLLNIAMINIILTPLSIIFCIIKTAPGNNWEQNNRHATEKLFFSSREHYRSVGNPDWHLSEERKLRTQHERKKKEKEKRLQANMKNVKISNECWNENNNNNDINDTRWHLPEILRDRHSQGSSLLSLNVNDLRNDDNKRIFFSFAQSLPTVSVIFISRRILYTLSVKLFSRWNASFRNNTFQLPERLHGKEKEKEKSRLAWDTRIFPQKTKGVNTMQIHFMCLIIIPIAKT